MRHAAGSSLPVPGYLEPGARISTVPGLIEPREEIRLLAIWTITEHKDTDGILTPKEVYHDSAF